jgi:DNA-binding NtrC family response regulator
MSGQRILVVDADIRVRAVLCDRIVARHPGLPVVMVSAYADVATASRALSHGAVDYVMKPFELAYLEAIIAIHLSSYRPSDSRRPPSTAPS